MPVNLNCIIVSYLILEFRNKIVDHFNGITAWQKPLINCGLGHVEVLSCVSCLTKLEAHRIAVGLYDTHITLFNLYEDLNIAMLHSNFEMFVSSHYGDLGC